MTITIGYWIIPFIVTLVAFGFASWLLRGEQPPTYGDGILGLFLYGIALIVSLTAWLVWSLV